jgi:hypothetical protein
MGLGVQRHSLATLPPGKTRYPLYRRLGVPQERSGRVRKISPPPGFDPRTIQPVASRYTDCAIPAPSDQSSTMTKLNMEYWWNDNRHGKSEALAGNPIQLLLCPQNVSHCLAWYRTRTSAVRSLRQTAGATVRSHNLQDVI